jgi:hypothetical protein
MNFIQIFIKRIEYGDYAPVAKFDQVYTEKIRNEQFTLKAQLLSGQSDWVLRLDLIRRWSGTGNRAIIDLHFHNLNEIKTPFQQLLQDVDTHVTEPNFRQRVGVFEKLIMNATVGKVIRSYGRIDHNPKNTARFKVELFLTWTGQQYWLLFSVGEGESVELTKMPIGVATTLLRLFPQIEELTGKTS